MVIVDVLALSTLIGSAAFAGAHLGGALLPWPGLHDWLVPGTLWSCPSNTVALTFDDGPDPTWTPLVLDRGQGVLTTLVETPPRLLRPPYVPTGLKPTKQERAAVRIYKHTTLPKWGYTIGPHRRKRKSSFRPKGLSEQRHPGVTSRVVG